MVGPNLARRERHALCDLAVELGPAAPTLCGEWDARHLLAHLWVREHRPLAAAGIAAARLAGWTERSTQRAARRGLPRLAEQVRSPGLTPFALPPVEVVANTLEYLVHHEDLRRARPGWVPRSLRPGDLDLVWRLLGLAGRGLVRPAGVPVVVRRADTGERHTLRGGEPAVLVGGPVVEIALFLFGRRQLRDLEVDGPPDLVARIRDADLGA